ncbi:hypothetical protein I316_06239 [Kwoniella heveanensis BCC8398]|uniref:Major facilitator superfamily (MFS) profile domain-containing protein n=1 Tax=Kwoniella heveanensis BCC8398 TaxID=1296120 RepID=A0A1B9GM62_9TREE|nr:hypothetical protein I316_06239 [Kwoniella heveanensis BCC8398]
MSAPNKDSVKALTDDIEIDVLESNPQDHLEQLHRAREDLEQQKGLTVKQGLLRYRGAVMWSALMTLTIVMEAYDYGMMGSLFGFPAFAQKFGDRLPSGKYNVSAGMQSVLKQVTKAGQLVGLAATGPLLDRFGYKWTMLLSLSCIAPVVVMQFLAPNVKVLIAAQLLIGIPLGPFLTLSHVYAAEVAPVCLRTYMTSATSLAWSTGGLISTGVLKGLLKASIAHSYRIAFAIQWVWLFPLAVIIWFAPESPTWCIKAGRVDRARMALRRLASDDESDEQIENRLALLQYTDSVEKEYAASTSYLELFKGVNLRRTEIAVVTYSCTNLDGYTLAASGTYFFQQAGMDASTSFTLTLTSYAIAIVTCLVSWFFARRFGLRPLYLIGLGVTVLIQLGIGALGIPKPRASLAWGTGALCWFFNIVFFICNGPLTYTIVADAPNNRLRSKTVLFARACFLASAVFMVVLTNYQINATAWNWRGKAGFFWAGSCLLCFVWAFFRLPESKGRSAAELDKLYHDRVPARKFASTKVEIFEENQLE